MKRTILLEQDHFRLAKLTLRQDKRDKNTSNIYHALSLIFAKKESVIHKKRKVISFLDSLLSTSKPGSRLPVLAI